MGRKKRSKPGDLKAAGAKVWRALETAEALLESEDSAERLKACHAVFQGAAAYARVYEVGELEARLEALERAQGEHPSLTLRGAA